MSERADIIAVSGGKNSGKTTFIEGLVAYFNKKGIKTAVIKHDGHSFEPDREGTDSRRFYDAGAIGTAVFDGEKLQIVKRIDKINIDDIFPEAGLVILEGFKYSDYPKIWMCSDEKFDGIKNIILWAGDCSYSPRVDKNDIEGAGGYILDYMRRHENERNN